MKNFKKLNVIFLLCFVVGRVTSCDFSSLKNNNESAFVDGKFKQKLLDGSEIFFDVKEIDENKYLELNKRNSVYDVVMKKYYSLNLRIIKDSEKTSFEIDELFPFNPLDPHQYRHYYSENGYLIRLFLKDKKSLNNNDCLNVYYISYDETISVTYSNKNLVDYD